MSFSFLCADFWALFGFSTPLLCLGFSTLHSTAAPHLCFSFSSFHQLYLLSSLSPFTLYFYHYLSSHSISTPLDFSFLPLSHCIIVVVIIRMLSSLATAVDAFGRALVRHITYAGCLVLRSYSIDISPIIAIGFHAPSYTF